VSWEGDHSIVDVRCKDTLGRQFIVEMQMNWNNKFKQRVVLNASKAVVKQLDKGETLSNHPEPQSWK